MKIHVRTKLNSYKLLLTAHRSKGDTILTTNAVDKSVATRINNKIHSCNSETNGLHLLVQNKPLSFGKSRNMPLAAVNVQRTKNQLYSIRESEF